MSTLSQARKGRCRDYNDDILLGDAKDDGIVQTTNRFFLVVKTIVVSNRLVASSILAGGALIIPIHEYGDYLFKGYN